MIGSTVVDSWGVERMVSGKCYQQRTEIMYSPELKRAWTREQRSFKPGWGPWKEREEIRSLRKNSHKLDWKVLCGQRGKLETIKTSNLLSHIVQRTFLCSLEMHRKSIWERRNFQCVLESCLQLTGHLLDCGCLQKTGRTLSYQCLLWSLPRSPKEGEKTREVWFISFLESLFTSRTTSFFKSDTIIWINQIQLSRNYPISRFFSLFLFNLNYTIREVGSPS